MTKARRGEMERVSSGRRTTTAIELTPAMDAIIKRITVQGMLPVSFLLISAFRGPLAE